MQLDLLDPDADTQSLVREGIGRVIESERGAWRARYTGHRWGWCLYRNTTNGWETWEPNLPHGMPYVHTREQAVQVLTAEIGRHGDAPLVL